MGWTASGSSVYADGKRVFTWDAGNVFDSWDLNPLAMQIGLGADGVRDSLATARDNFLQPLMADWRNRVGPSAGFRGNETDADLWSSPVFRDWVQTGAVPITPNQIEAYQGAIVGALRNDPNVAQIAPELINATGGVEGGDANILSWLANHGISTLPAMQYDSNRIPVPARSDADLLADVQTSASSSSASGRSGATTQSAGRMFASSVGGMVAAPGAAAGGTSWLKWLVIGLAGYYVYKHAK